MVVWTIGNSLHPIEDSSTILLNIARKPVSRFVLTEMVNVIGAGRHPVERASDILRAVINHSAISSNILKMAVWAIKQNPEMDDAQDLLVAIVKSDIITKTILWDILDLVGEQSTLMSYDLGKSIFASNGANEEMLVTMVQIADEGKIPLFESLDIPPKLFWHHIG